MIRETFSFLINSFADKTPEWISAFAAVVSAAGVFLVWQQVKITKSISQLQFEDLLEKEYRDLAARIPTKALIGFGLSPVEYTEAFDELFRYFDLSNKQVMLRKQGRIGDATWDSWRVGIKFNLSLPVFEKAWHEIKLRTHEQADEFFSELRKLEDEKFSLDPKSWK